MRRTLTLTLSCLAVSACGGDGDGDDGSNQFRRAIEPQAQERAESVLLALSDFPDGWGADPAQPDDPEDEEAFNDCIGADYSAFTLIGEAESDDFALGQAAQASSEAEVFETEEMAAEAVSELAESLEGDEADACMKDLLGEFDDAEVEITEAELGELSFTPPAGVDDAEAWQFTITVEGKAGTQAEGVSVTGYGDFVQIRRGSTTAEVTTFDVQTPFDPELRDELVAAVGERMAE